MDGELNQSVTPVSEGQSGNVDTQGAATESTVDSGSGDVASTKPVQTPEQNAQFAAARREAERQIKQLQADNDEFAKSCGFNNFAEMKEYQKAQLQAQKAQEMNVDLKFYSEFESVKSELNQFKTEKQQLEHEKQMIQQDNTLKNDPVKGELYKTWETEVKAQAKTLNCDLNTSFLLMLDSKLGDVLKGQSTKAEQQAIQKLANNAASTPGSLADGGEGSKTFFTKEEVKAMSQSEVSKNYDKICESMKKW